MGVQPVSPRIERFAKEAAANPVAARAALVAELAATGGPIIELLEGEPARARVTFVYVGKGESVAVYVGGLGGSTEWLGEPMERVESTDVWWHVVESDARVSTTYSFLVDPPPTPDDWEPLLADPERLSAFHAATFEACRADPYSEVRLFSLYAAVAGEANPPAEKWDSVLTLPAATPLVWPDDVEPPTDRPSGTVCVEVLESEMLGNRRDVHVYLPPGVDARTDRGSPLPTVVLFDGVWWQNIVRVPHMLDRLIADGVIPPMAAVLVGNAPFARTVELTCNPALIPMVCDELLPTIRERFPIATDPGQLAIGGASYGGLASLFVALERPEVFGNVIAMSPSTWFGVAVDGKPEWITRQYTTAPKHDLRFWIDVGTLEASPVQDTGLSMVACARHLRDVLTAKGYEIVGYREQPGGHNFANWRRTLPDALVAMFGRP